MELWPEGNILSQMMLLNPGKLENPARDAQALLSSRHPNGCTRCLVCQPGQECWLREAAAPPAVCSGASYQRLLEHH